MPVKKLKHPAIEVLQNLKAYLTARPVTGTDQSPEIQEQLLALIEVGLADRHNALNGPWFTGNPFYWERATGEAWRNFYLAAELTTKKEVRNFSRTSDPYRNR